MPSIFLQRNFAQNTTYHLRHQAKNGTVLFRELQDYKSFIVTLSYYLRFPDGAPLSWVPRLNPKTLASKQGKKDGPLPTTLHAFLLLPDHFHLVLTENIGGKKAGISELMRRVSVGYAMTYRKRYGGEGTIYQGKYKQTPLTKSESGAIVSYLHSHKDANSTFLRDQSHSSLFDYENSPRSWVNLLPILPPDDLNPKLKLEQ